MNDRSRTSETPVIESKYKLGKLPLIIDGGEKVHGEPYEIIGYLADRFSLFKEHLFNTNTDKSLMRRYCDWIETRARPFVNDLYLAIRNKSGDEEINKCYVIVRDQILNRLNGFLGQSEGSTGLIGSKEYFSGQREYNAVDLVIFAEVQQILLHSTAQHKLSKDAVPKLAEWYEKLAKEVKI